MLINAELELTKHRLSKQKVSSKALFSRPLVFHEIGFLGNVGCVAQPERDESRIKERYLWLTSRSTSPKLCNVSEIQYLQPLHIPLSSFGFELSCRHLVLCCFGNFVFNKCIR